MTAAPEKYDGVSTGHRCPAQMEDSKEILMEGLFTKGWASWERKLGLLSAGSGGKDSLELRDGVQGAPD